MIEYRAFPLQVPVELFHPKISYSEERLQGSLGHLALFMISIVSLGPAVSMMYSDERWMIYLHIFIAIALFGWIIFDIWIGFHQIRKYTRNIHRIAEYQRILHRKNLEYLNNMESLKNLIDIDKMDGAIHLGLIMDIQEAINLIVVQIQGYEDELKNIRNYITQPYTSIRLDPNHFYTLYPLFHQEILLFEKDKKQFTSLIHSWLTLHATELSEYQKEVSAIKASLDSSNQYTGVMNLVEADLSTHTEAVAKISSR